MRGPPSCTRGLGDHCARLVQDAHFHCRRPLMGLVLGLSLQIAVYWILRNKPPRRIDAWFRKLQLPAQPPTASDHGETMPKNDGYHCQRFLHGSLSLADELAQGGEDITGQSFLRARCDRCRRH